MKMLTGRNIVAVAGSMMVMSALYCGADGQSFQGNQSLPTRLGDITQPEAVPIPLTPRHHALPITPVEKAEGGIIWGAGREVQAGLRIRLRVRGEQPGQFLFDVFLRNKTDRPLTVKCPWSSGPSEPAGAGDNSRAQSDRIYCSPIMEDKHGKPVDLDLRQGTEERKYSLAPGQIVQISHWMLRTRSNQAQNSNRMGQTQVAYVSPGAYLMSCGVKAEWEGQISDIRTGKVPFDVLKADVEEA
jgi:hypothetical protein